MEPQKFLKARLTIQEFTLPNTQTDKISYLRNLRTIIKRPKIFITNSNFQRKHHSSNPQVANYKPLKHLKIQKQRMSQPDQFLNNLINLPDIDEKPKISIPDKNKECNLITYKSAKLLTRLHSKAQKQQTDLKYKNKMEILRQASEQTQFYPFQKKIRVNCIDSKKQLSNQKNTFEQMKIISKQKLNRKAFHFNSMEKNHLNRLKSQDAIPLELHTQRYTNKTKDQENANLQFKNYVRFKFDNDMYQTKDRRDKKKVVKNALGLIEGWGVEVQRVISPLFYN